MSTWSSCFELPNLYIVHCGHSVQIQCVGPGGQGPHFYARTDYIVKRSQLQIVRSPVAGGLRLGPLAVVVARSNDSTAAGFTRG